MNYTIDEDDLNKLKNFLIKRVERTFLIILPICIFIISEIVREYGSRLAYEAWMKVFVATLAIALFRFINNKSMSKILKDIKNKNEKSKF